MLVKSQTRERTILFVILLVALLLRLANALSQDSLAVFQKSGGDSGWYMANGYALVAGVYAGKVSLAVTPFAQTSVYLPNVPTAPLYLILVGIPLQLLSPERAVVAIRLLQTLMGTATVYFVYGMAKAVGKKEQVGLLAAAIVAISPVFILESAQILTETTYVFFLTGGLWAYIRFIQRALEPTESHQPLHLLVLAGGFLGLAVLTRAVLFLFPLGLVLHLVFVFGWRNSLRRIAVLLSVYIGIALIWTVFNLLMWNQLVIGAQGFAAFLYLGSTNAGWQGPSQADAALAQQAGGELPSDPAQQQQIYQSGAVKNISSDIPGWLKLRAIKLIEAYLQPHGTTFFPGESLKDVASNWLTKDRTLNGLLHLMQGEAFWPKLVIYGFHVVGLLAGLGGMVLTRRNWRVTLPLLGFILYTSLIHFVIDASPRYLFPMEAFWWAFAAAVALAALIPHRTTAPSHLTLSQ